MTTNIESPQPHNNSPKVVFVDMDDVLCDYSGPFAEALKANPGIAFPQSQYGYFLKLLPVPGALEAIQFMDSSPMFDPYILTAPSYQNPLCYTEKRVWVEKYLGLQFTLRLIICRGDFLIDDHIDGKGQENFDGELIHFGSEEFPDWQAVRHYLNLSVS